MRLYTGYPNPDRMEYLHAKLLTGTLTKHEREDHYLQWMRIVLSVMRHKFKRPQKVGWDWRHGYLLQHQWVNNRHESLYYFLLDWVIKFAPTCKTSLNVYAGLTRKFYILKGIWELQYRGVGGVDPHKSSGYRVGAMVQDWAYCRGLACQVLQDDNPTVEQVVSIISGEHPGYTPTERERKGGRRYKNLDRLIKQWTWFSEVLQPEVTHDDILGQE